MFTEYTPKPVQVMQFTGANEADIRTWLEGFGYNVTVSVNAQGNLDLSIQELNQRIFVLVNDFVLYDVPYPEIQPVAQVDLNTRFDVVP